MEEPDSAARPDSPETGREEGGRFGEMVLGLVVRRVLDRVGRVGEDRGPRSEVVAQDPLVDVGDDIRLEVRPNVERPVLRTDAGVWVVADLPRADMEDPVARPDSEELSSPMEEPRGIRAVVLDLGSGEDPGITDRSVVQCVASVARIVSEIVWTKSRPSGVAHLHVARCRPIK